MSSNEQIAQMLSDLQDELQELRKENQRLRDENQKLRDGESKPDAPENEEIVENFFTEMDYADSTERPYRYNVKYLREYVDDKPLCDVTEGEAWDFANNWSSGDGTVEPSTMESYLRRLKRFYGWLGDHEWGPDENVVASAYDRFRNSHQAELRRSGQNSRHALEPHEYVALLKWNRSPRIYALLLMAAKTGLRRKELRWLKVKDIDISNKKIYNCSPKGVGEKRLPKDSADQKLIDDETADALNEWINKREEIHGAPDGWLFPNSDGDPVSKMTISRRWEKATDRAVQALEDEELASKIDDYTPHNARHCFTTWLNQNNCPRDIIAALRGDAAEDMVSLYTQLGEETVREEYEEAMPSIAV